MMRKKILTFNTLKSRIQKLNSIKNFENRTSWKYTSHFKYRHFMYTQIRFFSNFFKFFQIFELFIFFKIINPTSFNFLHYTHLQKNLSLQTKMLNLLVKEEFSNLFFLKWSFYNVLHNNKLNLSIKFSKVNKYMDFNEKITPILKFNKFFELYYKKSLLILFI